MTNVASDTLEGENRLRIVSCTEHDIDWLTLGKLLPIECYNKDSLRDGKYIPQVLVCDSVQQSKELLGATLCPKTTRALVLVDQLTLHKSVPQLLQKTHEYFNVLELHNGRLAVKLVELFHFFYPEEFRQSEISWPADRTKPLDDSVSNNPVFLRKILDSVPQVIFAKDRSGRYIYSNRAANEFYSLDDAGMFGKTFSEFNNDQLEVQALERQEVELFDEVGKELQYRLDLVSPKGEKVVFNSSKRSVAVFDENADTIAVNFSDITELDSALSALASESAALQKRNDYMSALGSVSRKMLDRLSLAELCDYVASKALALVNADCAFVGVVNEAGDYLELMGSAGVFDNLKGFRYLRGEGVCGNVWQSGEKMFVEDYANFKSQCPEWPAIVQSYVLPFGDKAKVNGVIGVAATSAGKKMVEDVSLLELFVDTVATPIELAILTDEQNKELDRRKAVNRFTQTMYEAENLQGLVDDTCKTLLDVFGARKAIIFSCISVSRLKSEADWQCTNGEMRQGNFASVKLLSDSIIQWTLDHGEIAHTARGELDERDSHAIQKLRTLYGLGSTVCVPLVQSDRVRGLLYLARGVTDPNFSDAEIGLLEVIGIQLTASVVRQYLLDKIHHQAFHDNLTTLPNRLQFEAKLKELIRNQDQQQPNIALLILDLDGFKAVNDNQGHSVGDKLLQQVGKRLSGCLQSKDLLARMGGDEFAVLLPGIKSRTDAVRIAERLNHALSQNFQIDGYALKIGVSVGLSLYPEDGETIDELVKNADFAMYEAKSKGKNIVQSFSQSLANTYRHKLDLEADLELALERNQFELHYQPKMHAHNLTVHSVEALLRWNHPRKGRVSPFEFIPIAEEIGLITKIGDWVLEEAIRQTVVWHGMGFGYLEVAVNIASPQFRVQDFSNRVIELLNKHRLAPKFLELEMTESIVMDDVDDVKRTLLAIQSAGIRVAVDDFGTGYSSLSYLEELPLNTLKIDKAFVDKLGQGNVNRSMASIIVQMARSFGLKTVAEGVETVEQLDLLRHLGCDYLQGYYFSMPLNSEMLPRTLREINTRFTERKTGT